MVRTAAYAIGLVAVVWSTSSSAQCDLSQYDQTGPRALTDIVDNPTAKFRWSSDVDRKDGIGWVWNFISNEHPTKSLSATWNKANIKISVLNPLPPNGVNCNKYPVINIHDDDIDDHAPIIYGNTNIEQRAAIYKQREETSAANGKYISEINSTYLDGDNSVQSVYISFSYTISDGKITDMGLVIPTGISVGFVEPDKFWSDAAITKWGFIAKSHGASAALMDFKQAVDFFKYDLTIWEDRWSENTKILITDKSVKDFNSEFSYKGNYITELIVFDVKRKPITSGYISIPNSY